MLDHGLRQSVGFEFVGVVAAELAPVGFDDLVLARGGGGFEDLVGLVELLGAAVGAGVAALALTLVKTAGADAQYRLDLRQLERRHA